MVDELIRIQHGPRIKYLEHKHQSMGWNDIGGIDDE